MADVALVVGHHPDAPGAALSIGSFSTTEYAIWSGFARELARTLRPEVEAVVFERPDEKITPALLGPVNDSGASCAVSLHHNAVAGKASGTEMLYFPGSEEGRRLAASMQRHTLEALGLDDRGIRSRRDLAFLDGTRMPAVIAEPAFGSDEADAWRLLTGLPDLLRAYRKGITNWLSQTTHDSHA
jgi:N-acetylmuramoyl-L-alanine amidase